MPTYVIPDIHGHADKLEQAIGLIESDGGPDAKIVFLGDYIDRGPDSKGVLQQLVEGKNTGRNWIFLKGNHDRMMEFFFADPMRFDPQFLVGYSWFHKRLGGIETLASYGVKIDEKCRHFEILEHAKTVVPNEHLTFLSGLELYHQTNDLLFVHAGLRPGVPFEEQTEQDMLWIRQEFHESRQEYPWLIVHGHSPVDHPTHYGNRVNLDAGAGYGKPLAIAVFEGRDCWLLDSSGRTPLKP